MRDKLKRRKKSAEESAKQPAPLQPAYFETQPENQASTDSADEDPAPLSDPAAVPDSASEPEHVAEPGNSADEPVTSAGTSQPQDPNRRPRRRRRGGRGRKRPVQRPTVSVPATADDSAPAASVSSIQKTETHASKGIVVLAIGLPGSGKSTWFKRHNITPLSSDLLRSLLFDDPDEQRFQDLVFSNLRSMLRARLLARRPVNYVDATNLTPHDRHSWIKLSKDSGYEVQAVFFDVPLDVCLERNQRRQRVVSGDVMRQMSAKLKPPTFDEGFSKITVVRVKAKQTA